MPDEIPLPLAFNPYKHHFGFLLKATEKWQKMPWEEVEPELLCIGSNLIDFYLGELSVEEVSRQTVDFLTNRSLIERDVFLRWLDPPHWKKIELSDGSKWLIKQGNDTQRYVHIHPAKRSPHTTRVRAVTLKTVLALEIKHVKLHAVSLENLESVNQIRKEYLNLSPIKSLRKNESGILRLWKLFRAASY